MEFKNCKKCRLYKIRRNVITGEGRIPAKVLFMGTAPNKIDDLMGKFFLGQRKKIFDKMLFDAKLLLAREKGLKVDIPSHYLINTVLCYPSNEFAGNEREPFNDEIKACENNIKKIINKVKPLKIVFFNSFAERKYKKIFPESVKINDPEFLLKSGGIKSPFYLSSVRKLSEVFYSLNERGKNET